MVSISLCMIVKNEEDVIGRCLKSVEGLVDEIIIVDTGSSDKTKEIAKQYTSNVYDFNWIEDFSAARNYSFSLANGMYCMWLDADDVMLEADRKEFMKMKAELTHATDVVMMKYNTGFDDKGKVTFSFFRERIIKNNSKMKWIGAIHEVIETVGNKKYSNCAVTHQKLHPTDPDRNLRIFEKTIANGITLDPRLKFYYGRELYYHKRYEDAIKIFEEFLEEDAGWIENKIDACRHCAYCYYGLGQNKKALELMLKSFVFDKPRAEICCDIGKHFFDKNELLIAIYWYERAINCDSDSHREGFVELDAYGYIPSIQMCVCHSRLGDIDLANKYNEKAAYYKPESEAVIGNRVYFEAMLEDKSNQ